MFPLTRNESGLLFDFIFYDDLDTNNRSHDEETQDDSVLLLDDIPDEIMLNIVDFTMSRKFHYADFLLSDLWTNLLRSFGMASKKCRRQLIKYLQNHPTATSLSLDVPEYKQNEKPLRGLEWMTQNQICVSYFDDPGFALMRQYPYPPLNNVNEINVTNLGTSKQCFIDQLKFVTGLRKLSITANSDFDQYTFLVKNNKSSLQKIHIQSHRVNDTSLISELLPTINLVKNLTELILEISPRVVNYFHHHFHHQQCPVIYSTSLKKLKVLSVRALDIIHCPNLKSLSIVPTFYCNVDALQRNIQSVEELHVVCELPHQLRYLDGLHIPTLKSLIIECKIYGDKIQILFVEENFSNFDSPISIFVKRHFKTLTSINVRTEFNPRLSMRTILERWKRTVVDRNRSNNVNINLKFHV